MMGSVPLHPTEPEKIGKRPKTTSVARLPLESSAAGRKHSIDVVSVSLVLLVLICQASRKARSASMGKGSARSIPRTGTWRWCFSGTRENLAFPLNLAKLPGDEPRPSLNAVHWRACPQQTGKMVTLGTRHPRRNAV